MKKMNNKELLKVVVIFLVGALVGWLFTARMYGAGPLASLRGLSSDASMGSRASCNPDASAACCSKIGGHWDENTGCTTATSTGSNRSACDPNTSSACCSKYDPTATWTETGGCQSPTAKTQIPPYVPKADTTPSTQLDN